MGSDWYVSYLLRGLRKCMRMILIKNARTDQAQAMRII